MGYFLLKTLLSALIIAAVSELGRRIPLLAALLASLPLISLLAMVWLYRETADVGQVARLSWGIFWLVIPSLLLFVLLPTLLNRGFSFGPALGLSCLATSCGYLLMVRLLTYAGVKI